MLLTRLIVGQTGRLVGIQLEEIEKYRESIANVLMLHLLFVKLPQLQRGTKMPGP